MFVITLRSVVFSAATLFTVLTSAAAAQNLEAAPDGEPSSPRAQSTSDSSRNEPASQSNVAAVDDDDAALVLAEPDFRVLNLPSTLRLPLRGSSFQLTHRFNGNVRQGSFDGNASNLSGSIKERRSGSSTGLVSRGICKPLPIARRSTRPFSSTVTSTFTRPSIRTGRYEVSFRREPSIRARRFRISAAALSSRARKCLEVGRARKRAQPGQPSTRSKETT
jgi:hypothetical protein